MIDVQFCFTLAIAEGNLVSMIVAITIEATLKDLKCFRRGLKGVQCSLWKEISIDPTNSAEMSAYI
jgi:hypothetical protein